LKKTARSYQFSPLGAERGGERGTERGARTYPETHRAAAYPDDF